MIVTMTIGQTKKQRLQTNAPPLLVILMAMTMHQCNAEAFQLNSCWLQLVACAHFWQPRVRVAECTSFRQSSPCWSPCASLGLNLEPSPMPARNAYLEGSGLKKEIQTIYIAPSSTSPYEYDHPDGTGYQVSIC